MRALRAVMMGLALLSVSACSADRDITLRRLVSQGEGPDEFSVLPSKPLQAPADFTSLPQPTPGGRNLVDQDPLGDAVDGLGGRRTALVPAGVPAADSALVAHAGRRGAPSDIRQTVAAEDREYRERKSRFTKWRIFVRNKYNEAYQEQTLDSWATNQSYRATGVQTPSVPPRQ